MADTTIKVAFVGDTRDFTRAVRDIQGSTAKLESGFGRLTGKLKGLGAGLAGAFAVDQVVDFGAEAVNAASSVDESLAKIKVLFGQNAAEIESWSARAASAFGQSQEQALAAAGVFGNLFETIGVGDAEASRMSMRLTTLASDLASFNNTSVDDALLAIQSGLRGENEPLARFGVLLNESTLKAEALRMGLIKTTTQALTPQQKAMASYSLILSQTGAAQGDFARTSDGLANKQRVLAAKFANLKAELGERLLPIVDKVVSFFIDKVIPFFEGGLPDAVGNAQSAFEGVGGTLEKVRAVFADVVAFVQALWQKFGNNILEFTRRVFGPLKQTIEGVLTAVRGVFQLVTGLITGDWKKAWEGVKNVFSGIWNTIQGVAKTALEAVRLLVGVVLEVIGNALKAAWEAFKRGALNAGRGVVDFFKSIPGLLVDAFVGLADLLTAPFRAAFNAIAGFWNDTIGSLSFTVPNWIPGVGGNSFSVPDIPQLADGGIVTRPTLALIGEAGPEAVVPLGQMRGSQQVTVNVYGDVNDANDFARKVADAIAANRRRGIAV